jgi:uncharacterized membrane protein (UPF0127 family)
MRGLTVRLLVAYGLVAAALIAGLILLTGGSGSSSADGDTVTVRVGGVPVQAELALTEASRRRGFSGRPRPRPGAGILFVFDGAEGHDFWMRGVAFPLDMIWIRAGRVTGVTARARPAPDTASAPLYPSPGPVDRVLEVPGGWAAGNRVARGDPYRGR